MKSHDLNAVIQQLVLTTIILSIHLTTFTPHSIVKASTINLSVVFVLGDETPADFFVGNIPKQAVNFDSLLLPKEKLRSTMLDSRGLAPNLLHLNDLGDLYTTKRIDRDDEANICGPLDCCSQPRCNLNFEAVFIRSKAKSIKVSVTVQMVDHNDHAPHFPQGQDYILSIPEAAQLDTSSVNGAWALEQAHSLPVAKDADSSVNGVVRYMMTGKGIDAGFFLLSSPNSACFPCLLLSNVVQLDYENPEHHNLTLNLIAIDGGAVPKSSSILIHIKLTDMNDHAPVFIPASDTIKIVENHTYYQPVYIVKAFDADSESNAKMNYVIASPVQHSKFMLDADIGELFIHPPMDYENFEERHIELLIVANDNGRPTALSSTFTLTVLVSDTNDNEPEVIVQQNNTIAENGVENSLALQITIKDVDDVSQGKVTCHLDEYESRLNLVSLADKTFLSVWTTQSLDYEKTPFVYFNLICHDSAGPAKNTTFPLAVKVSDRNDNAPVFYSTPTMQTNVYELTINEAEQTLRPIFLPRVVDPDGGPIVFSLDSNSDCPFEVKSDTGAIYLKTALDYETIKFYEFFLVAKDNPIADSGDPAYTSKALFRVTVKDHNDCHPKLISYPIILLKRDTPAGYLASQIAFKDDDMNGTQGVSMKLVSQTAYPPSREPYDYFTLKENGDLITLVSIAKDPILMMSLLIIAIDQADTKLQKSTTATLTVIIEFETVDTLRIINPFPGSVVNFTPAEASSAFLIHLEYFDMHNKPRKEFTFALNSECNGSSLVELDSDNSGLRLRTGSMKKIVEFPSKATFKVCVTISDSNKRKHESKFFVQLDWRYQPPGQALWPADSADASADVYPDLSSHDRRRNGSHLPVSSKDDSILTSGQKPLKFSLSNIVMFLLILAFSLAVGFALFAAILWARAKQAISAAHRRRNGEQVAAAQETASATSKPESTTIWTKPDKNENITLAELGSASCSQHKGASLIRSKDVHYAILTSENHAIDLQTTTFLTSTSADDTSKSGGPIVAYFDLIVSSPSTPSAAPETCLVSLPDGGSKDGLVTNELVSSTPAVGCYLVL